MMIVSVAMLRLLSWLSSSWQREGKLHYYRDPILFLLLSHCRFFCSIYSPWVFYEILNFYFINIELYQSRLSVTVDGRKSLRITVRDALLSKKAFMAFALIGVTGNETYQIQVLY